MDDIFDQQPEPNLKDLNKDPAWKVVPFIPPKGNKWKELTDKQKAELELEIRTTFMAYRVMLLGRHSNFFPKESDNTTDYPEGTYYYNDNALVGHKKSTAKGFTRCTDDFLPLPLDYVQFHVMAHEVGHHITLKHPALREQMDKLFTKMQPKLATNEFMKTNEKRDDLMPANVKDGPEAEFYVHLRELAADLTAYIYEKNKFKGNSDLDVYLKRWGQLRNVHGLKRDGLDENGKPWAIGAQHDSSRMVAIFDFMNKQSVYFERGQNINFYQAAELALSFMNGLSDELIENYNTTRTTWGLENARKTNPHASINEDTVVDPTATKAKVEARTRSVTAEGSAYCAKPPPPPRAPAKRP